MKVQLNTDTNIEGSLALTEQTEADVAHALARFEDRLTRIEIHFSNESAGRTTGEDFRCLVEARPMGLDPVAVTHHAATLNEAFDGAMDKLVALLSSKFDRLESHRLRETIRGR